MFRKVLYNTSQWLGIAAGRDNCCVCPQPLINKDIQVKDKKQKPKDACAGTATESELRPIVEGS